MYIFPHQRQDPAPPGLQSLGLGLLLLIFITTRLWKRTGGGICITTTTNSFFFPSSQTISQLQTNPNQKIFSLHLLAELTKVIKAIGSPVQKEQNVPCLHHLYNHGDAKHLHRVSMEMLNSAGPCIPAKERHSETEPLTTLLSIQPVFPPACSPPIQSVSPSLATRILKTTTVQLVSRWSKSPPRA